MTRNRYLHPEDSPLFSPWTDPRSGVVSYILSARVAPWQQSFYFTNQPVPFDGRYMWVYASCPPTPFHTLGVVDFKTGEARLVPETAFKEASPMVDLETGEVYWAHPHTREVYRRGPGKDDPVQVIGQVPWETFGGRPLHRISTHLSFSADRKWLNLDIEAGDTWHAGAMELATGKYENWDSFDRRFNHSLFSPVDPDLQLIAQDWWNDVKTGVHHRYVNRIYLLRRGEKAQPIYPNSERGNRISHEWWGADGSKVWYVDYDLGTFSYELASGATECVWPGGTCHSQCDGAGLLLTGDINTYKGQKEKPVRIGFFNRHTGKEIDVVSDWPVPPMRAAVSGYHVHGHPQFICDGEFITYSSTVYGRPDVALVRVADLVKLTSA